MFVIYGKSTCGGQVEDTNEIAISYAIGFEKISGSVSQCDHKTILEREGGQSSSDPQIMPCGHSSPR